jgi:hypothetical protein
VRLIPQNSKKKRESILDYGQKSAFWVILRAVQDKPFIGCCEIHWKLNCRVSIFRPSYETVKVFRDQLKQMIELE